MFGEQRRRLVAILREFGPDDRAAPTRCTDWSVYDVALHLYDSNATAGARPGNFTLDITADFDPRISPASG